VLREFLADTRWGQLDWLLVDMPPGADRFETLVRLVPQLTGSLIVTTPSIPSQGVVRRSITSAQSAGARILGLIVNMVSAEHPQVDLAGLEALAAVPYDPRFAETTDAGRPYVLEHADAAASRAIIQLARILKEMVHK